MTNLSKTTRVLMAYSIITTLLLVFFIWKNTNKQEKIVIQDFKSTSEEQEFLDEVNNQLNFNNLESSLKTYETLLEKVNDQTIKRQVEQKIDFIKKTLSLRQNKQNENVTIKNTPDDFINNQEEKNLNTTQYKQTIDSLQNLLINTKEKLIDAKKTQNASSSSKIINFKSKNGTKVFYIGDLTDNKANGKGTGIYALTGSMYVGEWRNNLKHGYGQYEWADGVKYEGNYENDLRKGFGKYFWPSGERYEGEWDNDKRNGFGTLFDINGNIKYKGDWINDKPLKQ